MLILLTYITSLYIFYLSSCVYECSASCLPCAGNRTGSWCWVGVCLPGWESSSKQVGTFTVIEKGDLRSSLVGGKETGAMRTSSCRKQDLG